MATSLFGALFQGQQDDWLKNTLVSVLNNSQGANQFGLNRALPFSDQLGGASSDLINKGSQFSFGAPGSNSGGQFTQLSDMINNALGNTTPGQFKQSGLTGGSQDALGYLLQAAQGLQGPQDQANSIFQQGGKTDQSSYLADRLTEMLTGQGYQMDTMASTGANLLGNRGFDPFSTNLQNFSSGVLGSGGNTDNLNAASQGANKLIGQGGVTPELAQLFQSGQGILQKGGQTPFTQAMQALGLQRASANPLMSPMQAAGFAKDQAAQNIKNGATNFRTQAVNRGGGPGASVANGTNNSVMADFADQGAAATSKAVQDALLSQQGLGLQEQGLGSSMGLGAAGLGNQQLGIGSSLASGAAGQGSQNLLASLGLLPTVQNSATSLLGTGGNLGLGAGQLAQGNLAQGGNLLNNYNQTRTSSANSLNSLLGNQNQFAIGAGGLANNAAGIQGGLLNDLMQGNLSGDQLGLSQSMGFNSALNNLLSQKGNNVSQGLGLITGGMQPLGGLAANWTNYASNGLGMQAGLFGNYKPTSALGSFFDSFGSSLAGAAAGG